MSTKTITVRVDEDTKDEAEVILKDIGINMTVLFNACLKAVVREKRVPFALVSSEYEFKNMIRAKLEESETAAENQAEKRYTHDEIFIPLRKQFDYEENGNHKKHNPHRTSPIGGMTNEFLENLCIHR